MEQTLARSRELALDVLPAVLAVVVSVAFVLGSHHWLRTALTVVFFMVMPGLPFARLLTRDDQAALLALAVALSLSLDVAVSMAMLWSDSWSPALGLACVVTITLIGTAARLLQRCLRRR
ncbi:MAG: hypothetical protein ACRD0K_05965 [Egibacteraceae bacterium]